jgi:hypothetical protein
MGYRQYTSCVTPLYFGPDLSFTHNSWQSYAGLTVFIGLIVAGIAASLNVYVVVITIGLVVMLITFLTWWLYGRLICLGGEECVIGVAMGRPHSLPRQKAGDDDSSFNILLAPGPTAIHPDKVKDIPKEVYWNEIQGRLTKEQDSILQIGRDYVQDEEHVTNYIKKLHCEFEGSGIRNLLAWASVVLALLIALLLVQVLVPPLWGTILAIILWILVVLVTALAALIGFDVGPFHPLNPGDPGDVNPNLGKLEIGDIVVLKGDWIYDSLHTGWNEIHAVHAGEKIGHMGVIKNEIGDADEFEPWPADLGGGLGLDTPEKVEITLRFWCDAIKRADEAEEAGSRDDPAQNWILHPLIDGCTKVIIT